MTALVLCLLAGLATGDWAGRNNYPWYYGTAVYVPLAITALVFCRVYNLP